MAIAMFVLFVVGTVLARIGVSPRGGDAWLAFVGSVAIGVSVLWFLLAILSTTCGSNPGGMD